MSRQPNADSYNSEPGYIKDLIQRSGMTLERAALQIGIGYRTLYRYACTGEDHTPAPYPVQYALERLQPAQGGQVAKSNFYWSPEQIAMLGEVPDAEIAELRGTTAKAVGIKRRSLNIRLSEKARLKNKNRKKSIWTEEKISLIGNISDREVARAIGLPIALVRRKRLELGIPAFVPVTATVSPHHLEMLGSMTLKEGARLTGLSMSTISKIKRQRGLHGRTHTRWTPDVVAMLGTIPDRELAERLGVSKQAVYAQRSRRGIKRGRASK